MAAKDPNREVSTDEKLGIGVLFVLDTSTNPRSSARGG